LVEGKHAVKKADRRKGRGTLSCGFHAPMHSEARPRDPATENQRFLLCVIYRSKKRCLSVHPMTELLEGGWPLPQGRSSTSSATSPVPKARTPALPYFGEEADVARSAWIASS
jgi:hypothetical protein